MCSMETGEQLDAIDRRILRALQADGRMIYDALAAQVSLSPSATLRRVKRLEESGVIAGMLSCIGPVWLSKPHAPSSSARS
jgi:Lrp/AsnC family leucine-responsive transcriptional regulator